MEFVYKQFGGIRIRVDAAPTDKKEFSKLYKGRVPDLEKAFKEIKEAKKELDK